MNIITIKENSLLTFYKDTKESFRNTLHSLGAGVFASAYEHPTRMDLVVKVGISNGQVGGSKDDYLTQDGYCKFLRLVQKHPSKFFPKILDIKFIVTPNRSEGVMFVVTMERLSRNEVFCYTTAAQKIDKSLSCVRECEWKYKTLMRREDRDTKNLGIVLNALYEEGHGKDLHNGNWLVRKKKSGEWFPVITDPVV